jgi:Nin one binding (NOB1) Zn-ribbon like
MLHQAHHSSTWTCSMLHYRHQAQSSANLLVTSWCGYGKSLVEKCNQAGLHVQNVAMQMGLRLSSRTGRRILTLQRFAMRCEGCSTVCKATDKVFCPACGHATLSRVSVSVGPDGAEQYGVRKKHVLRGTRCASKRFVAIARGVKRGSRSGSQYACLCACRSHVAIRTAHLQ